MDSRVVAKFDENRTLREMQVGYNKSRFSTNITLYLGNDTRHGGSYYGIGIEKTVPSFRMVSF